MNHQPKLILVNGVSSSGRTSLVKAFTKAYPQYVPLHIDEFTQTLPQNVWDACASSDEGWVEIGKRFNQHIVALMNNGKQVIADTFYKKPAAWNHLFNLIDRSEILYVQLYCELEELERREQTRKNRRIGLARSQFQDIYSFTDYDLKIDSTYLSINGCVRQLVKYLSKQLPFTD